MLVRRVWFGSFRTGSFADKKNGANRDRTGDLLLAKQALSQLSYGPSTFEFRELPGRDGAPQPPSNPNGSLERQPLLPQRVLRRGLALRLIGEPPVGLRPGRLRSIHTWDLRGVDRAGRR
jgi:hypothetical protein